MDVPMVADDVTKMDTKSILKEQNGQLDMVVVMLIMVVYVLGELLDVIGVMVDKYMHKVKDREVHKVKDLVTRKVTKEENDMIGENKSCS